MTIDISANNPRISYSVAAGVTQTSFAVPFEFFDDSDLNVYIDTTLQTITTNYTVTGGAGSTGTVTMTVTGPKTVIFTRDTTIERTTDFTAGVDINRAALNTQLDTLTAISADNKDLGERSIRITDYDPAASNLLLPDAATRADKLLSFDTEGDIQVQAAGDLLTGSVLGANYTKASHTGDGTQTAYSTVESAGSKNNIQVYIDGVYQNKDTFSISGSTLTFSEAPPLNSSIEFIVGNAVTSLTTDPAVVTYNQGGTGAQDRTLTSKLQDTVSVKDFGAVGDGVTDDTAAIQAALDAVSCVFFPAGTYNISAAVFPNSDQSIYFQNAKLFTTQIITGDECAIKLANVGNVEIHGASIDCNNYAANSGIIVREDTSNIRICNTKVVNAAYDAVRGGGRGVLVEANSGTEGKIIIDGVTCDTVDTVIGLNGYFGSRKNAIIVSNVVGVNSTKLIAIFGNGGTYPHDGDAQQFLVSNVVGYDITYPIRFDRAGNSIISNVYIYNSSTIDYVVRGTANNVHCSNIVHEGNCSSLFDGTPWNEPNGSTDLGYDTVKSSFQITNRGTASLAAITCAGVSRATLISNTTFDLNVDAITTNLVADANADNNTTALVNLYSTVYNCKVEGFLSTFAAQTLGQSANSACFSGTFTPVVEGSTSAGVGTYSIQFGTYSVIGNRVFFDIYLTWSAHTGSGNLVISGLPYTAKSQTNGNHPVTLSFENNIALTAGNYLTGRVSGNTNDIVFTQTPTGGGAVGAVPLDTSAGVMISGSYQI